MFTLPRLPIRIHSFRPPPYVRKRKGEPLVSLARKVPRLSWPNLPLEAAPLTCVCAVVALDTSSVFPFTCSGASGLAVPMPTFPLISKIADGTKLAVASNFAKKSSASGVMATAAACAEFLEAFGFDDGEVAVAEVMDTEVAAPVPAPDWLAALVPPVCGFASANADAGIPPTVSASAAFKA